MTTDPTHDKAWAEFTDLVNMKSAALDDWLKTDDSKSVGQSDDGGEATGHKSGRRIVSMLCGKRADLTDADWDHVAKVISYIKRHKAQGGPATDKEHSRWRYSLMNWGHDPLE